MICIDYNAHYPINAQLGYTLVNQGFYLWPYSSHTTISVL